VERLAGEKGGRAAILRIDSLTKWQCAVSFQLTVDYWWWPGAGAAAVSVVATGKEALMVSVLKKGCKGCACKGQKRENLHVTTISARCSKAQMNFRGSKHGPIAKTSAHDVLIAV